MNLRRLTLTMGCIFILLSAPIAQPKYDFNDGPYLEVRGDSIEVLWIENGDLNESTIPLALPYHFESDVLPDVTINDLSPQANPFERHTDVKKFVALSDIHGQHHVFIELLKKHQVIDSNETWIYGEGHLVIVGDVMDRGPQVTESLWFLYRLEKEAAAAGTRLVMATHNMGQARRLAQDVIFMLDGKVHETGPAAQVFATPQTDALAAFLRGDIVT